MQSGGEMIGIVGSGLEFSGEADGAGFVGAKEIQGEASQEREVLGGVTQADQAGIFAKGHVEAPVQAVLDAPVAADGGTDALCPSRERCNIEARLSLAVGPDLATALDHHDAGEAHPGMSLLEPIDGADNRHGSGLDAAVALLHGLVA